MASQSCFCAPAVDDEPMIRQAVAALPENGGYPFRSRGWLRRVHNIDAAAQDKFAQQFLNANVHL